MHFDRKSVFIGFVFGMILLCILLVIPKKQRAYGFDEQHPMHDMIKRGFADFHKLFLQFSPFFTSKLDGSNKRL